MFLAILVLCFFLWPRQVQAQDIPLTYQLLMAFHPTSLGSLSQVDIPPSLAEITAPQVLGVSTNIPSTPSPTPTTYQPSRYRW